MRFLKKWVSLSLAVALTFSLVTVAYGSVSGAFPDVPVDADYAEAISELAEMGIFTGDDKGNFNPDSTITRAEFATIMVRMLGKEDRAKTVTTSSFTDVPSSHWACGYITVAVELGLVNGYGNGQYGPSDTLTSEQAVKLLVCSLGLENEATIAGGYPNGYISVANNLGITYSGEIVVGKNISRAEVAVLMFRTITLNYNLEDGLSM